MSTLKKEVYILDKNSELFKLYKAKKAQEEKVQKVFDDIFNEFPEMKDSNALGIFSFETVGIKMGTDLEKLYDKELLKKERGEFRPFKKKSPTLLKIQEIGGEVLRDKRPADSAYGFEIATIFGMNNVSGTHFLNGELYISLRHEAEYNQELLTHVDYSQYLKEFAEHLEEAK